MDYSKLISLVQIDAVRVVDAGLRTKISGGSGNSDLGADLAHEVKLAEPLADGKLVYRVAFRFNVRPIQDDADAKVTPPEALVTVRAVFEVAYGVPQFDDDAPDEDILKRFGDVNALVNAWPYWREFVQASLARMSLPTFILPVLRVGQGGDTASPVAPS